MGALMPQSNSTDIATWIAAIPADMRARFQAMRVLHVGFRTGPGFCAGSDHRFPEPVTFEVALAWIFDTRTFMRGAQMTFEDRSVAWFERYGFYRYDEGGADTFGGIVVRHPP